MWDLIVSVPDHCLSFYFEISDTETRGLILSRWRTTKALIRLLFANGLNRFFSRRGSNISDRTIVMSVHRIICCIVNLTV